MSEKVKKLVYDVVTSFREKWFTEPDIVSTAPGRVNLIGEHTDYTGGFVLPIAINRGIVFAVKKSADTTISGYSINFDEIALCQVSHYNPHHTSGWFRYVMGVLSELERAGYPVEGFRFSVGGDIPIGSGLSSSAAFEMAVLTAMEALLKFKLDDKEAAQLCQRAENNFVGMNCGIMDQFISRMGRKDHALFIDCTTLLSHPVKIHISGYSWVVIDSKKRRGLVDSEYNKRRRECEKALEIAHSIFSDREIQNLRDLTVDDLPVFKDACSDTVYRRLKHVVTENNRVLQTVKALEGGDIDSVGTYMYASHESLKSDFEVSCEELDSLIEILTTVEGVSGARLTGAGFGGCVIAFLKDNSLHDVEMALQQNYHPTGLQDNRQADIWPVNISDGAHVVEM